MVQDPIDPANTARVYIDYTSAQITHTLMFRLGAGATTANAAIRAQACAEIFKMRMQQADSFVSARFSDKNSHFSLPIPFTPVTGVIDGASGNIYWVEDPESAFLSLIGRGTTTGRRTRWEFFTPCRTTGWPESNRYAAGASGPIDALRENWKAFVEESSAPGDQLVTVAGDIPVVYGYVNIAKNGYWQRKQR